MLGKSNSLLRNPALWTGLVLLWMAVLYYLSSRSDLPHGPEIPQFDKVKHAFYFMCGASMLFLALRLKANPPPLRTCLIVIVIFAVVVGALDEYHQTFTPGRSGNDWGDLLADFVGGLLGTRLGPRLLAWLRPAAQ